MQFKSFALFLTLLAGASTVVASPAQTSQTAKPTSRTGSNTSINHLATNLVRQAIETESTSATTTSTLKFRCDFVCPSGIATATTNTGICHC